VTPPPVPLLTRWLTPSWGTAAMCVFYAGTVVLGLLALSHPAPDAYGSAVWDAAAHLLWALIMVVFGFAGLVSRLGHRTTSEVVALCVLAVATLLQGALTLPVAPLGGGRILLAPLVMAALIERLQAHQTTAAVASAVRELTSPAAEEG